MVVAWRADHVGQEIDVGRRALAQASPGPFGTPGATVQPMLARPSPGDLISCNPS